MSHRKPPKYHTFETIHISDISHLDGLTLSQTVDFFSSIDTKGLLEPLIHIDINNSYWDMDDDHYDVSSCIMISGFKPMSDAQIAKFKAASERRAKAAQKKKQTLEKNEKEQLVKLAKKYPEVIRSDSYIV